MLPLLRNILRSFCHAVPAAMQAISLSPPDVESIKILKYRQVVVDQAPWLELMHFGKRRTTSLSS